MKRILRIGGLLVAIAAPALGTQVINFHNSYNYAYGFFGGPNPGPPLYGSLVYSGQGAYSDPGHNVWNGFGGGFNPTTGGYSPGANGHTTDPSRQPTGGIRFADGSSSSISLTVNYAFDNGGLYNTGSGFQGTASLVLGQAAVVNGSPTATGSFTLHNVPTGTYLLYLYGANNNNDRGAAFSVDSGLALGGVNTALNDNTGANNTSGAHFTYGANYVVWTGVTPNGSGDISGTWSAVTNPFSGNSNEGDFNGLQLVLVPEPSMAALLGLGAGLMFFRRRR